MRIVGRRGLPAQYRDGMGARAISLEPSADTGKPPSPGEPWGALCPTTSAPSHSNSFSQHKKRVRINGPHPDLQQSRAIPPRERSSIPRWVRIPIPSAEQHRPQRGQCRAAGNKRERGLCVCCTLSPSSRREAALAQQHGMETAKHNLCQGCTYPMLCLHWYFDNISFGLLFLSSI